MIKSLLYLAILTTATVSSWISFSVYHNYTTSTIDSDTSIIITPIQAEFDRETIERIKNKNKIDANLNEQKIVVTPTPDVILTPTATPSGQIDL